MRAAASDSVRRDRSRRPRSSDALCRACCEALELRTLLAVTFPDAAVIQTNSAGWDFKKNLPLTGTVPTLQGGANNQTAQPQYTLEFPGTPGVIPLFELDWDSQFNPADGTVTPGSFKITAPEGRASTGLIDAVANHSVIPTLILRGTDGQGRPSWDWTLDNATVPDYSTAQSDGGGDFGVDQFSLQFDKVTVHYIGYDDHGAPLPRQTFTYDVGTRAGSGSAIVGGPAPAPGTPSETLEIAGQSIPLDAYSWGESLDPQTQALNASNFTVSLPSGAATSGLLDALFSQESFTKAAIKVRDAMGRLTAQWNLGTVFVVRHATGRSPGDAAPDDTVELSFGRYQLIRNVYDPRTGQLVNSYGGGWDFTDHTPWGNPPGTPTFNPSAAPVNAIETMQIDGGVPIALENFSWGEQTTFHLVNVGGGAMVELPDHVDMSSVSVTMFEDAPATGIVQNIPAATSHAVTLIRRDFDGHEIFRYTLAGVTFSSFSTGNSIQTEAPGDSATLDFQSMKVDFTPYDSLGNPLPRITRSRDRANNTGDVGSLTGTTFAPGSTPRFALDAGQGLIPIDTLSWDFSPVEVDRHPAAMSLTLAPGRWSPGMFAAAGSQREFDTVRLNAYDGDGNVTASWTLEDVILTSYAFNWSDGATGADSASLSFKRATRTVVDSSGKSPVTYSGGWDFITGKAIDDGPGQPATLDGVTYAAGATPQYTLQIGGATGLLPVRSVTFGTYADAGSGFTPGVAPLTVQIDGGLRAETGLIEAVAGSGAIPSVVVVHYDAGGRPVQRWTLNNVRFTNFQTDDQTGAGGQVTDTLQIDNSTSGMVEWLTYDSKGKPLAPIVSQWDLTKQTHTIPPYGQTFAPGALPRIALDFGTGQIALNSFSWGESFPGGGPGGDGPVGQDFSFDTLGSVSSPALAAGVFDGAKDLSIVTRDTLGHVLSRWQLGGAHFDAYSANGAQGGGTPFDSFSLHVDEAQLTLYTLAPAAAVTPPSPVTRNTPVTSLTIAFSEPVTGFDLADLTLTRNGGTVVPLTGATLATTDNGRTWTLNLPASLQSTDGSYALSVAIGTASGVVGALTQQPLTQASGTAWVIDRVAPKATDASFDYVGRRRAVVTFGENVTGLTINSLTLTPLAGAPPAGTLPPISAFGYDSATRTATWTFAAPLPDGNYRLGLATSAATDLAGNPLALALASDFYLLGGDINRDRNTDFKDLVILAQNYNTTGKTYATGDITGDGKVDFNDLVVLAQHYNTSLPAPGEAVPAASPAPNVAFSTVWTAALATPVSKKDETKAKPAAVFSIVPVVKPTPAKPKPAVRR